MAAIGQCQKRDRSLIGARAIGFEPAGGGPAGGGHPRAAIGPAPEGERVAERQEGPRLATGDQTGRAHAARDRHHIIRKTVDQQDRHRQARRGFVAEVADRLRKRMTAHAFTFSGETVFVTASIGIASIMATDTMDSLVERADNRLYRAKRQGRNCVVWEDDMEGDF